MELFLQGLQTLQNSKVKTFYLTSFKCSVMEAAIGQLLKFTSSSAKRKEEIMFW